MVAVARPEKKVNRKTYSGRVAARLRAMRKERRWSDEKLWLALRGAGAYISMSTLRSWQNGNRLIHPDEYPAIAKAFGVELFEFLPPK